MLFIFIIKNNCILKNTALQTLAIYLLGYARGQAYKRHDFVDFPKILDMESYTHSSLTRRMKSFENIYKNNQFSSNQNVSNWISELRDLKIFISVSKLI